MMASVAGPLMPRVIRAIFEGWLLAIRERRFIEEGKAIGIPVIGK